MPRTEPILGAMLLSALLVVVFLAGRASMPSLPPNVSLHIATLEAQLAKERAANVALESRLAHVDEIIQDRAAETERSY